MVDLRKQDGLYTLFLNGIKNKEPIQDIYLIDDIVKCVNPYKNFQDYLDIAKSDSLEFVISNTTEAGIEFIDSDTFDMKPPKSYPCKISRFLQKDIVFLRRYF
jgi:tagaturonate reductase